VQVRSTRRLTKAQLEAVQHMLLVEAPGFVWDQLVEEPVKRIVIDTAWQSVTKDWSVTDYGGLGAAADSFDDVDSWAHDGVADIVLWAGGPDLAPLAPLTEPVIQGIHLPIDRPLSQVSLGLRIIGVGFGILTGNPVLTSLCTQDLMRQLFTKGVVGAVHLALANDLSVEKNDPAADGPKEPRSQPEVGNAPCGARLGVQCKTRRQNDLAAGLFGEGRSVAPSNPSQDQPEPRPTERSGPSVGW
jgi:hypothetical protein